MYLSVKGPRGGRENRPLNNNIKTTAKINYSLKRGALTRVSNEDPSTLIWDFCITRTIVLTEPKATVVLVILLMVADSIIWYLVNWNEIKNEKENEIWLRLNEHLLPHSPPPLSHHRGGGPCSHPLVERRDEAWLRSLSCTCLKTVELMLSAPLRSLTCAPQRSHTPPSSPSWLHHMFVPCRSDATYVSGSPCICSNRPQSTTFSPPSIRHNLCF